MLLPYTPLGVIVNDDLITDLMTASLGLSYFIPLQLFVDLSHSLIDIFASVTHHVSLSFSISMQIQQLIVQLFKYLMDWVSRKICYAVGDIDKAVSSVGPRIIVSSKRLGEWSLYTS